MPKHLKNLGDRLPRPNYANNVMQEAARSPTAAFHSDNSIFAHEAEQQQQVNNSLKRRKSVIYKQGSQIALPEAEEAPVYDR
jgi:hypothetical protein